MVYFMMAGPCSLYQEFMSELDLTHSMAVVDLLPLIIFENHGVSLNPLHFALRSSFCELHFSVKRDNPKHFPIHRIGNQKVKATRNQI